MTHAKKKKKMTKLLGFKKLTVWLESQAPNRAHAQDEKQRPGRVGPK